MDFLFIDFLNSDWHDYRVKGRQADRLRRTDWLEDFLKRWSLEGPLPAEASTVEALVALRRLIRQMVEKLYKGEDLNTTDLAALNEFLKNTAQRQEIERIDKVYKWQLVPVKKDWNWVMAEIVASFGQLLARDEADRLKICQNPDCIEVFYDGSKNHTQRWCAQSTCGTLMKVRRFRAHKHDKADPSKSSSN